MGTGEVINNPEIEEIEKFGNILEKIEKAQQATALKQIEIADRDNQRQYEYALKSLEADEKKWNKSFFVGTFATITLGALGIYLMVTGKTDIGLGILSTTISGVFGYIAGNGNCNKASSI